MRKNMFPRGLFRCSYKVLATSRRIFWLASGMRPRPSGPTFKQVVDTHAVQFLLVGSDHFSGVFPVLVAGTEAPGMRFIVAAVSYRP